MMTYKPYPRSLYRREEGAAPERHFDGIPCAILTVDSEEEEKAAKAEGWRNSPAEAGKVKGGDKSAEANPFDHDGDGKPGGSKPRKKTARKGVSRGRSK